MLETQSATNKPVTSISEALTLLKEYSELRWQKSLIEAKLSEINGLSIKAAQLIVEKGQCINGKRIVYRDGRSEITLQFKTQNDSNNPQLKKLKQRIDSERNKAIEKMIKPLHYFKNK